MLKTWQPDKMKQTTTSSPKSHLVLEISRLAETQPTTVTTLGHWSRPPATHRGKHLQGKVIPYGSWSNTHRPECSCCVHRQKLGTFRAAFLLSRHERLQMCTTSTTSTWPATTSFSYSYEDSICDSCFCVPRPKSLATHDNTDSFGRKQIALLKATCSNPGSARHSPNHPTWTSTT